MKMQFDDFNNTLDNWENDSPELEGELQDESTETKDDLDESEEHSKDSLDNTDGGTDTTDGDAADKGEPVQSEVEPTKTEEDEEVEEVEVPEWVTDDFLPPEEFKTQKEEYQWYKSKYQDLLTEYSKPEFISNFIDAYKENLVAAEQKVEQYKAVEALFDGNPELALKLYAPNILQQINKDPFLSEENIYNIVDEQLKQEFGEDYKEHFKSDDIQKTNTLSYKMFSKQQDILNSVENHQKEIKESLYQPAVKQVDIDKQIQEEYDRDFKESGYTREEYNQFVQEVKKTIPTLKLKDFHRTMYFDTYVKNAYEKGKKDGKLLATKQINKIKEEPREYVSQQKPTLNIRDKSLPFDLRNKI
jgi:hypothetical protein